MGVTWGDYLQDLSFNDALWILHQAIYSAAKGTELKHLEALNELAYLIENGSLSAEALKLLGSQLASSISNIFN